MTQSSFLKYADCIIECCQEKIKHNGEDSYFTSLNDNAGIVSVFDGCGGSGAKKYPKFHNKTGAYMSSRVVAGATKDWFSESYGTPEYQSSPAASLKKKIKHYLSICKDVGDEASALKGGLTKDFPTTASIVLVSTKNGRDLDVLCLSAGDSRCYLLSSDGLMQLTKDDLGNVDAMENLTADAVLTNVITTSKDFEIHQKQLKIKSPCILFTATDGCFGYLSTPMEFEYMLLRTLLDASSITEWESKLKADLMQISGDDFSLTGISVGFGSFQNLQNAFRSRVDYLHAYFISKLQGMSHEEKKVLWLMYKNSYEHYIKEPSVAASISTQSSPLSHHSKASELKPPVLDDGDDSFVNCPGCHKRISKVKFCPYCGFEMQKPENTKSSAHITATLTRPTDLD